ncbi:MAG: DUF1636 domain-containing protein [Pseudomonadota bacterium]
MERSIARTHRISVCVKCRQPEAYRETIMRSRPQPVGLEIIDGLREALSGRSSADLFELETVECMAGCDRPCTVAYHAAGKATYLFGDIVPGDTVEALADFADQYAALDDGWCSSTERPKALAGKTLARVPAISVFAAKDAAQ